MDKKNVTFTGGARIAKANATFPFARLTANKNRLDLNASIIGSLSFMSSDIISIEPYQGPKIGSGGLQIIHNVEAYHEQVIFWTLENPTHLIEQIRATGFLDYKDEVPSKQKKEILARQKSGGNPVKKPVLRAALVAWNVLFLMDIIPQFLGMPTGLPFMSGMLLALSLFFSLALFSLISSDFRRLVLKEGRTLEDIKRFAIFILIITGSMMIALLGFLLAG